ncbi:Blp family class II bacteriocin [Xylella fastidiosa subsp. multiplex]|uniref:Bacteriocin n=1 Tax=Xylella fastidiosa subsp. multiplex TaxID=644357 RepID=A0A9Q4QQY7_XYLFS|nr:Blp family class II bacteriocin [Xylella fastidiosa]KAJ4851814.1 Blp family class II bacteriocin [Xylella fastidiosa subsp. multiplex]MBE0269930.1 hypothetical protein [Xylella fastidiosa subsp. multiplex]MBE0276547.1 hypothetical protein [Xylella fastidiosa subsp. multiplex]MBE0278738.1 hypothetical protein [Xylella fastidiosa subsp. multiplex]MBE0283142.1 hypothetical protein [Xylella fastidiosa subsp. multiplex]
MRELTFEEALKVDGQGWNWVPDWVKQAVDGFVVGAGISSTVFGPQSAAMGAVIGGAAGLADYVYSHANAPTQQQQDFQKMVINWGR